MHRGPRRPRGFRSDVAHHLTALEQTGRRIAVSLTTFLRAHHPTFARAEIGAFPTRVGIRESRRVRGESTITAESVLRGLETPNGVAFGTCLATGQAAGLAAAWQSAHCVPPSAADVRAQIETLE